MLETLTSIGKIAGSVGVASTITDTVINEDGSINKKGAITSTAISSATTASIGIQEHRLNKVLSAQEYVESLTTEELEEVLAKLEQKEELEETKTHRI